MLTFLAPLTVAVLIAGLIAYGYWWHNHGDGKRHRDRANQESKDRAPWFMHEGGVTKCLRMATSNIESSAAHQAGRRGRSTTTASRRS